MSEPTDDQVTAAYNSGFSTVSTLLGNDADTTKSLYDMTQDVANTQGAVVDSLMEQADLIRNGSQ